jgi:hypothetical protein
MQLGTPIATTGLICRSISLLLQILLQEMLAVMMMLVEMTMLKAPTTSMTGKIDFSGRVASLFSLFGVLMPKGEK